MNKLGFGTSPATLNVYCANRPNVAFLDYAEHVMALSNGDIESISRECGNGWRKIFNVYAKLAWALPEALCATSQYSSWQAWRNSVLLQVKSSTALYFGKPSHFKGEGWHIIMGRTFAHSLADIVELSWLDRDFAICEQKHIIACPYFDYRQLTNEKIDRLVAIMTALAQGEKL